jgi:hypothetical protein
MPDTNYAFLRSIQASFLLAAFVVIIMYLSSLDPSQFQDVHNSSILRIPNIPELPLNDPNCSLEFLILLPLHMKYINTQHSRSYIKTLARANVTTSTALLLLSSARANPDVNHLTGFF